MPVASSAIELLWMAALGAALGVGLQIAVLRLRRRRRRALAAVDGSAYLRAIAETAPDAIIATKADGTIDWSNQASVGVFGRDQGALLGCSIAQLLPAFERRDIRTWMDEHGISGHVVAHDTLGRRVDDTSFPCAVSVSAVTVQGVAHYTFFVRDTSDSKWAENELRLREAALESAGDGVVISSMTLPGQPIIYANPAFLRMTGYALDEVIGTNCSTLQSGDVHQQQLEELRLALAEGRGCRVILRNYRKDGSLFWNLLTLSPVCAPEGGVTHYVGVQSDITARMDQEDVLRLRTERLNTVFDLSPDGFVAVDAEGTVRMVNPAFAAMTGFSVPDLIGHPAAAMEARLAAMLSSTEELEGQDSALLHLRLPTVRTLLRRVRHNGSGQASVMYFRDITRELEVDRMKSEFLSMAAHELRTPMASIFGFTELLLKRQFDEVRRQDMLTTIHRQAQLLINLINELLDLARIEARRGRDFQRRLQPLAPLIERTLHGLLVNGDDRRVALQLPDEPVLVDVDDAKLGLAITNVVSNAYKYSSIDQGIELELVDRVREGVGEVGIRVRDHGIGMTPEQLARVFERFFRADSSGSVPGTGLGMTIVKEIVDLHGGQVEVESSVGAGTVVTLWLPLAQAADGRSPPVSRPALAALAPPA